MGVSIPGKLNEKVENLRIHSEILLKYLGLDLSSQPEEVERKKEEYVKLLNRYQEENLERRIWYRLNDLGVEGSRDLLGKHGPCTYDEEGSEIFQMELRALKRSSLDIDTVIVPYVSSPQEIKFVRKQLSNHRVKAEIGMMAEIPATTLNIQDFLDYVDLVDIGTGDLTSLLFGLGRDRESRYEVDNKTSRSIIDSVAEKCSNEGVDCCLGGPGVLEKGLVKFACSEGIDFLIVPKSHWEEVRNWIESQS